MPGLLFEETHFHTGHTLLFRNKEFVSIAYRDGDKLRAFSLRVERPPKDGTVFHLPDGRLIRVVESDLMGSVYVERLAGRPKKGIRVQELKSVLLDNFTRESLDLAEGKIVMYNEGS